MNHNPILIERECAGEYQVYKDDMFICQIVLDDSINRWKFVSLSDDLDYLKEQTFSTYALAKSYLLSKI